MKSDTVHIGVDVSSKKLDVYNPVTGVTDSFENEASGFRKIRDMARKHKAMVCCEPTGGYELELVLFMQRFKVPVAYCDGYRVRCYARSRGEFSKNDAVDARMISLFADHSKVNVIGEKDRSELELRCRWKLYQALNEMHVILAQKASSEHDKTVKAMLERRSKSLRNDAQKALAKCEEIAACDERMNSLLERFLLIDGVGPATALAILALLPEIGRIGDAAITKLAGLVPMDDQSGDRNGSRHIFGGRRPVRNALYMASIAAVKFNHILKPYYQELKKRMPGPKASKWALVPVMRKLLLLMNRIARDPDFVPQEKPKSTAA